MLTCIGHTFCDALYLPAPVVTSRIMSTAKHVHRTPLDGERCIEVKKARRNKGDRRGGDEGFYMSCRYYRRSERS